MTDRPDSSHEPLPAPKVAGMTAAAGWYPDPFGQQAWRWFDGTSWTAFTGTGRPPGDDGSDHRRPRLPKWLSPPVLVCGILTAFVLILIGIDSPWSVVAGLVPLLIVLPVLRWLDRVEPEPRTSKVHAVLWGATVAVTIAGVANALAVWQLGEVAAMIGSAPLVEEAAKALGIVWAVRRREVDGVTDGIVYAGWVALGFAVVEDVSYFALADVEGELLQVVVLRALLTPFAHPLFTFWTGLAIGRAVHTGRRLWPYALWGYALAVLTHAAWNGSLLFADVTYQVDEEVGLTVVLLAMLVFLVLFIAVAVTLFVMRRREQRRFVASVPALALRYHISPDEAQLFVGWRHLLRQRHRLGRDQRRSFDRMHAALARLSLLHERPGDMDLEAEQVYASQLSDAVTEFRSIR